VLPTTTTLLLPTTTTLHLVNAPPVCSGARPNPAELWPPNHAFVAVSILGLTDPDNDPLTVTITGFLIAFYYYILHPELPKKLADRKDMLYLFLYNKWYFDELYDFLFVRPAFALGRFLWKRGDGTVIDGLGPDGIAARVLDASRGAVRLQTGYVYHYAFAILIGAVVMVSWYLFQSVG